MTQHRHRAGRASQPTAAAASFRSNTDPTSGSPDRDSATSPPSLSSPSTTGPIRLSRVAAPSPSERECTIAISSGTPTNKSASPGSSSTRGVDAVEPDHLHPVERDAETLSSLWLLRAKLDLEWPASVAEIGLAQRPPARVLTPAVRLSIPLTLSTTSTGVSTKRARRMPGPDVLSGDDQRKLEARSVERPAERRGAFLEQPVALPACHGVPERTPRHPVRD